VTREVDWLILVDALGGWTLEERVHDPLGRPITARLGWIEESSLAIVEMASASGLCHST